MSYLRSIYLHKDKSIFKIDELPVDRFAESLGLPGAPKIKFLNKDTGKKKKNASRALETLQAEIEKEAKKKMDSNDEDLSSSDEEETHLDGGNDKPAQPKVSSSTTKRHSDLTLFLALRPYKIRQNVRA